MRLSAGVPVLWLAALCAGCASHRGPVAESMPGAFNFGYYDHLPEAPRSARGVALKAEQYLDHRFPAGSDLKPVLDTLTAAGAKCTPGVDPAGAYSACYYRRPARVSLVAVDWSIIIRLDPSQAHVTRIEVNRYFTHL